MFRGEEVELELDVEEVEDLLDKCKDILKAMDRQRMDRDGGS